MNLSVSKTVPENQDEFKKAFKYYKSKKDIPDFAKVLNYHKRKINLNNSHCSLSTQILPTKLEKWSEYLLVKPVEEWEAYRVLNNPGLIIICNGLTELGSMLWVQKCVQQYSDSPFRTNLSTKDPKSKEESWWSQVNHYLEYSEKEKSTVPKELQMLCKIFLAGVGLPQAKEFDAEAAIVNYYPPGSTLSAHTDHSEPNKEAPLLSVSLGRSSIFLIGGKEKSVTPTPILLHHGDVLIMSGPSRQCYHAVPRILSNEDMVKFCLGEGVTKFKGYWRVVIEALNDCFRDEIYSQFGYRSNLAGMLDASRVSFNLGKYSDIEELRYRFSTDGEFSSCSLKGCLSILDLSSLDILALINYVDRIRININVRQVNCKGDEDGL